MAIDWVYERRVGHEWRIWRIDEAQWATGTGVCRSFHLPVPPDLIYLMQLRLVDFPGDLPAAIR